MYERWLTDITVFSRRVLYIIWITTIRSCHKYTQVKFVTGSDWERFWQSYASWTFWRKKCKQFSFYSSSSVDILDWNLRYRSYKLLFGCNQIIFGRVEPFGLWKFQIDNYNPHIISCIRYVVFASAQFYILWTTITWTIWFLTK